MRRASIFGAARALAAGLLLITVFAPPAARAASIDVQRVTAGGIEAWLVEDHTNPIIAMSFLFAGGGALDPDSKAGLARMTMALLDEGAGEMDSQAFQGRLEDLAVGLSFDASLDTVQGSLLTLTENSAEAVDLLGLALTQPRFEADAVERIRSQLIAGYQQASQNPGALASWELYATLFPDHPYGRQVDGTPASLGGIKVDDLRQFAGERLAKDMLIVGVVGDVTPEQLKPLLTRAFGALPEHAAPAAVADVAPAADGEIVTLERPLPQSAVAFAQPGLKRDDPDFYTAVVLNHILGGGSFTSRLFGEVRDRRGLTYSVSTDLQPLDRAGLIVGYAATDTARVDETVSVLREEWRRLATDGVTPDELADAKANLTGSFPLRFTSSPRIANILVAMQYQNLGIDYLDKRNDLIEAVTRDDVNRLAARLLDPEALTMVVVGRGAEAAATPEVSAERPSAGYATSDEPPAPPSPPAAR